LSGFPDRTPCISFRRRSCERFCDELEKLPYQILAGRREGDKMDQIEIFITYSLKQEEGEF
jgi:hypothetical protein